MRWGGHTTLWRGAPAETFREGYIPPADCQKMYFCLVACVGATIGRPPTYRSNTFSGMVFLQGKRARASNARPYKSVSTVCSCPTFPLPTVPNGCLFLPLDKSG